MGSWASSEAQGTKLKVWGVFYYCSSVKLCFLLAIIHVYLLEANSYHHFQSLFTNIYSLLCPKAKTESNKVLHLVRRQFSSLLLLWWGYLFLACDCGSPQNCVSEVVPFESSGIFVFFWCLHISWSILSTLKISVFWLYSSLNNDLFYSLRFFKTSTCGRNTTWTSNQENTGFLNLQEFGFIDLCIYFHGTICCWFCVF